MAGTQSQKGSGRKLSRLNLRLLMEAAESTELIDETVLLGSCLKSLEGGVAVSIVLEAATRAGSRYLSGQKYQDCLDDTCLEVSASWGSSCC